MALKHHPDRNQKDKLAEESSKEISQAYEVLSDPTKRAATYDHYGHAAFTTEAQCGCRWRISRSVMFSDRSLAGGRRGIFDDFLEAHFATQPKAATICV